VFYYDLGLADDLNRSCVIDKDQGITLYLYGFIIDPRKKETEISTFRFYCVNQKSIKKAR